MITESKNKTSKKGGRKRKKTDEDLTKWEKMSVAQRKKIVKKRYGAV